MAHAHPEAMVLTRHQTIAQRYRGHWNKHYALSKLRTDPVYAAAAEVLLTADDGKTPVLDLGCGLGLFAFYLKASGYRGPVEGWDYDRRKVAAANEIVERFALPGLHFEVGDVRSQRGYSYGHVVILDVLQYLVPEDQNALLEGLTSELRESACLIIRSGLKEKSWRFQVTKAGDWFARGCFWMKGRPVAYPEKEAIESFLAYRGMLGSFEPLWGKTPFNNYLGVFRKSCSHC